MAWDSNKDNKDGVERVEAQTTVVWAEDYNEFVTDYKTHRDDTDNPHTVTASQVSAVATSGNETVTGIKTFSSSPIVPTPTTDLQTATKKYVDDNSGAGDVVGPASAVDENITVFDSTTGKLIKDSGTNISAVTANSAKETNVSTNLSLGTISATTMDVNSSDGTNVTLISADTDDAGLLTATKFDEIVANNAKLTCDTTNVTSAGALMDSEVDADIKTLTLPASTTISTFGASLVDDAAAINARATLDVDVAGTDNSTDVTLNASATTGGMSLSTQEISNQASTNAQNGYMTSALVSNIETNNSKVTNATHTGDVTGATALTIGADKVNDTHIDWGTGANQVSQDDVVDGATYVQTHNDYTNADEIVVGNTSGTNTGDQSSIVGISGSKSQFDTACSDGNFIYSGDITQYTDEMAQDAVGGMVDTTLTYTDGTPELKVTNPVSTETTGFTITAGTTPKTLTVALDASVTGTNTGDQAAGDFAHDSLASITGTVGQYNHPTDANMTVLGNTSGTNTGDQVIPDNLTDFVDQTAWRVFYSNTDGDTTELALGADGTFLKSNGATSAPTFATPAGSGDVSKVGTPVDNQIGVWTGDGTIEGTVNMTYDQVNFQFVGDLGSTGTRITKGWFTDLQVTNAIAGSITGNAATVTSFTPASGSLTLSGADALTFTTTAATSVTLPTTGTLMANVVEDTTPQLGGDLDCNDNDITEIRSAGFNDVLAAGSKTASFDVDFDDSQSVATTLTANTMTATLQTPLQNDATRTLYVTNGGLATLTWAAASGSVKWVGGTAPTLTSSGLDIVVFKWDGTNWYGVTSLAFS